MDLSCRQNRLGEGEIGGGVGYFLDNGGFVELKEPEYTPSLCITTMMMLTLTKPFW